MEISQNETALKKTWFCGSRTAAANDAVNFDFNGQITRGTKLRFHPTVSTPRFEAIARQCRSSSKVSSIPRLMAAWRREDTTTRRSSPTCALARFVFGIGQSSSGDDQGSAHGDLI